MGRSWGSCQISGEDEGDTVNTMGRQGVIMKLGSKKKIEHSGQIQWVYKTNTESVLTLMWLAFKGKTMPYSALW